MGGLIELPPGPTRRMTHQEGVQNIFSVYARSTPGERERGRDAYRHYRDTITRLGEAHHSPRPATSVGVFVALSPNNDERGTYRDMVSLLDAWHRGEPLEYVRVSSYPANRDKAGRILAGEYPEVVLSGRKTQNFFWNVWTPEDPGPVTVDGHMYSVWHGKRYTMDEAGMSVSLYDDIANGFHWLAPQLRLLPSQLQAVCWITWRRMHRLDRVDDRQMSFDF